MKEIIEINGHFCAYDVYMNQMLKPSETINKAALVRHSHIIPTITTKRAKTQAGQRLISFASFDHGPACTPLYLMR